LYKREMNLSIIFREGRVGSLRRTGTDHQTPAGMGSRKESKDSSIIVRSRGGLMKGKAAGLGEHLSKRRREEEEDSREKVLIKKCRLVDST